MVKLINKTKNIVFCKNAQIASSLPEKIFGLLNPKNSRFLIINTRFGIHTMFLKQPIDVVVISHQGLVVKQKSHLKQNTLFLYNPKFQTIIEMPQGTINKYQIKLNDKISIE